MTRQLKSARNSDQIPERTYNDKNGHDYNVYLQ